MAHARLILSWHENLVEKEIPPQWMWPLDEELERHFERIKDRRSSGLSDPDDDDDDVPGLTVRNEYARGRGRAR